MSEHDTLHLVILFLIGITAVLLACGFARLERTNRRLTAIESIRLVRARATGELSLAKKDESHNFSED